MAPSLNLLRLPGNNYPSQQRNLIRQILTTTNTNTSNQKFNNGRFNVSMLSNIVNSRPGCSSCGK